MHQLLWFKFCFVTKHCQASILQLVRILQGIHITFCNLNDFYAVSVSKMIVVLEMFCCRYSSI